MAPIANSMGAFLLSKTFATTVAASVISGLLVWYFTRNTEKTSQTSNAGFYA
jgi:hypothetical protein